MHSLITPDGEIISASPDVLRRRFGNVVSDAALAGFAIRNLGYAGVACDRQSLALRITPSRLKLAALQCLHRVLGELAPRRVSISWYDGAWHHEVLPGVVAARSRLGHLIASARKDAGPAKYIVEPRALSSLPMQHPFAELVGLWRAQSNQIDFGAHRHILDGSIAGRYSLIGVERASGQAYFHRIGPGYALYNHGRAERLAGLRVDDQPDIVYGRAVSNCYRVAAASVAPQINDVDTYIVDPAANRVRRGRYQRLALPLPSSENTAWVLSATLLSDSIDLRAQL